MKSYTTETLEFHYTANAGTGHSMSPTGENDNFASTLSHHFLDKNRLVLKHCSATSVTIDCYLEHEVRANSGTLTPVVTINMTQMELVKNEKTLLTLANTERDKTLHPEQFLGLLYIFKFETTSIAYIQDTELHVFVDGYENSTSSMESILADISSDSQDIRASIDSIDAKINI